jgi:hypothetical protein
MRISARALFLPKRGSDEAEYEDAFYPGDGVYETEHGFRCAVADGATESAFARLWARLLVRSFGRRRWSHERLRTIWRRAMRGKTLPWYLQAKAHEGAHAAFVGLSIRNGGGPHTWRALAVGDSCLFHVRDGALLQTGPVASAAAFDNSPFLLSSAASDLHDGARILGGQWEYGDTFYLATDALAAWILGEHEADRPPWPALDALDAEGFVAFVDALRGSGELHNDDTTLLRVEVV